MSAKFHDKGDPGSRRATSSDAHLVSAWVTSAMNQNENRGLKDEKNSRRKAMEGMEDAGLATAAQVKKRMEPWSDRKKSAVLRAPGRAELQ